jgi:hypothetical protein
MSAEMVGLLVLAAAGAVGVVNEYARRRHNATLHKGDIRQIVAELRWLGVIGAEPVFMTGSQAYAQQEYALSRHKDVDIVVEADNFHKERAITTPCGKYDSDSCYTIIDGFTVNIIVVYGLKSQAAWNNATLEVTRAWGQSWLVRHWKPTRVRMFRVAVRSYLFGAGQ